MKNILTPIQINQINKICSENNIKKYTIRYDGSIDVHDSILWVGYNVAKKTRFPIKINKVSGLFTVKENNFTSMVGGPKYVDGDYICSFNQLTNLVGCPLVVTGKFSCNGNRLTSLKGCPQLSTNGYTFTGNGFPAIVYQKLLFENNMDNINVFLKYQDHFEVWEPVFNVDNFNDLITEIEEGLK